MRCTTSRTASSLCPEVFGTLAELFEAPSGLQRGVHAMPGGLLDVAFCFDPLLAFPDRFFEAGFVASEHRGLLLGANTPEGVHDGLLAWKPLSIRRWIGREET